MDPTLDDSWQDAPVDAFDQAMLPLDGGHSGETFLAEAGGERSVVRVYAQRGRRRGPAAVEVDAAVLRLVRGLVPVPEVLEVVLPNEEAGTPALLVTSFLPGERLDVLLPRLHAEQRRAVGVAVGEILARLAGMPLARGGFFTDGELRVEPLGPADLTEWVASHREGTVLDAWDDDLFGRLLAVADRAQTLLDGVDRACLVHSDFNPKNLLVDPATMTVTGLLDWEFAHAGYPVTDLGNLMRFDREQVLADAVLATYAERVPDGSGDLLDRARAADLYALVDLAGRRGMNPVTERAYRLLETIARCGDLHARPDAEHQREP
jgi:aminoglycoside phosphotransferase (APT) family kinase protein